MSAVALRLDVWPDGAEKPTVLEVKPRDVLAWERNNRGRSAVQLGDEAWKLEYLYEVAWQALGQPGGDFAKFCATTDVTWTQGASSDQEDEAADPTSVAASTES